MRPLEEAATEETGLILAAAERAAALRPRPGMEKVEEHADWHVLSRIPMRLVALVPLPRFSVKDLLALRVGSVVLSAVESGADVPLRLGGVQLGWSEFEVVEQRMAVRLTRLA